MKGKDYLSPLSFMIYYKWCNKQANKEPSSGKIGVTSESYNVIYTNSMFM